MFAGIRSHIENWASSLAIGIDHEWHKGVMHFMQFAEGAQAEQDAVNLLLSKGGYTITKNGAEVKATT